MGFFSETPPDPVPLPQVGFTPMGAPPALPPSATPITAINSGPKPEKGFFGKVADITKAAGHNASDNLFGTPDALKDIVSADDVRNARRQGLLQFGIALSQGRGESPLASLGRGLEAAQGAFGDSIQNVVAQKKQAQEQAITAQQQNMLKTRAMIAQKYLPKPNETAAQTDERMKAMAEAYASAGDMDMAGKVGSVIKDLREPNDLHSINVGNKVITTDGRGKTVRTDLVSETAAQIARDNRADEAAKRAEAAAARAEKGVQATNDRITQTETRATRVAQNAIIGSFEKATEDYGKSEEAYNTLQAARENPKNFMTPVASLDALARLMNPKAAVRQGTINYLKEQGAFGDKTERWLTTAKSGTWPEGMQQKIWELADSIMSQQQEDFDTRRSEALTRADEQGLDRAKMQNMLHNRKQYTKTTTKKPTGGLGSYK